MKKAFVCLLLVIVFVGQSWSDGFNSVHSPNGADVWAVGNGGSVFHSIDGGVTWSGTNIGSAKLRSVYAIGSNIWVVGDSGFVYTSIDGGTNWSQQILAGGSHLYSVVFANPSTGWAAGANGAILKSLDGGATWVSASSPASGQLNALSFSDPQTIYVAGNGGTLLKSGDGGASWTNIAPGNWTASILSVSANNQAVYVSGTDDFAAKSTDAGATWNSIGIKTDTRTDVNAVFGFNASRAVFVGGGGFVRMTGDGGTTYSYGLHQLHSKLNSVFFYSPQVGWACGEKTNVVLRTTDSGQSWQLPQGTTVNYQWVQKFSGSGIGNTLCVNPWNKDRVYVVSGSTVWMSGDRGDSWAQTATISTGGSTWSFYVSPKDTNVWIAATSGGGKGVRRTTNRGQTWTTTLLRNFTSYGMPLEMDPDRPDTVIFAAEGTGSGPDGILYISTNFGATWDTLAQTQFRSPCDIVIVPGKTNVWYVGDGTTGSGQAQMWRSGDYGHTWTSIYSSNSSEIPMIAVSRLRNTEAFATAWSGVSYSKSTNAGESWSSIANTNSTWGTDVAKDDPNVVIYGTYGGSTSYFSTNAGTSFTTSPLSGSNSGLLAYDRGTIIAHQTGGVYKYVITYVVPTTNAQAVTLISPNGGENWSYNSVHNITWAAGNLQNVKLEYRIGSANPWQTIAASIPASAGSFAWTVPNTPSTQARVRISDVTDSNPADTSNANFSITVSAIAATPGSLDFGSVGIGRNAHDTIRIANSGTGPLVITGVTTGSARFIPGRTSFTIPPGGSDTLSVSFVPTAEQSYGDTLRILSNAPSGPVQIPLSGVGIAIAAVNVMSPNGGESWQAGSAHAITWSFSVVSTVSLYYRSVPGNNWRPIVQNIPAASGSYSWLVPEAVGQAVVRVVASTDPTVYDESDSTFTILPLTSIKELEGIPTTYELAQNYPNPFNPSTEIVYGIPTAGRVTLTVFNSVGQEVARLVDGYQLPGRYSVRLGGTDSRGTVLASGVYYYALHAGEHIQMKKMVLLK
jgi:photosystem II stability/assembly factor-like uncharacterized protein